MKKILLILALWLTIVIGAVAQTDSKPNGNGTAADPYQINSLDNLCWLMKNSTSWDKHFKQTKNIDAKPTSSTSWPNGWIPIGNSATPFSGTYDGQGFIIDNLTVKVVNGPRQKAMGFFGQTQGATITMVALTNANVYSPELLEYIGILVGYNVNSTISNCYVTGTVKSPIKESHSIGGLVGTTKDGSISCCYSNPSEAITNPRLTGGKGGLVGQDISQYISVSRSFYNKETSQCKDTYKGDGKTTAEMKDIRTYINAGWDFTNIWGISSSENEGYPTFLRQITTTTQPAIASPTTSGVGIVSATVKANLTKVGSPAPYEVGFCYSTTNPYPTVSDSKVALGEKSSIGEFSASLTNLTPSTTYFVRAYAINAASKTYVYSNVPPSTPITFKTLDKIKLSVKSAATCLTKSYDGNTNARIAYRGELAGIASGDKVSFEPKASYADARVGKNKTITGSYILSGPDAAKYNAPDSYTITTKGEIYQKFINSIAANPVKKVYDGTINTPQLTFTSSDFIPGEDVWLEAKNGRFADANAGTNKTVTVDYIMLRGANADNYMRGDIDFFDIKIEGCEIAPKPITVTPKDMEKKAGRVYSFAGTEFTTSRLFEGDKLTSVTLTSDGAAATASLGKHDIEASNAQGTGLSNYSISYNKGTLNVVDKLSQTITFTNPGAQLYGTTPTLSATVSSGLPVTFTTTTPNVCSISSDGKLSFASAGTCTVVADQAGDADYKAAPSVSQSFAVSPAVPSAPIGVTAIAGDEQARVEFFQLNDGGSPITSYTVTANPSGVTATGTRSPIVVNGLTNGTAYTFTVTASNAAKESAASEASPAVTPFYKPDVLVVSNNQWDEKGAAHQLQMDLSKRYDVTVSTTGVPASLDGYAQIYDVRVAEPITSSDATLYTEFLKKSPKRSLFLAGECLWFKFRNPSITSFIEQLGGGTIAPPAAESGPNKVALKVPFNTGASSISNTFLDGYGIVTESGKGSFIATETNGTSGSGLYFPQGTLANAPTGRLVVMYDITFLASAAEYNYAFRMNLEQVMGTEENLQGPSASTISLSGTPNPTAQLSPVTFTATVTPTATGEVQFVDVTKDGTKDVTTVLGSATLENSVATFTTTALALGAHTITAKYIGDANFNASTSNVFKMNAYDVPDAPSIGTATAGDGQATVSFTPPAYDGGLPITGYTLTAAPGNITATNTQSPIVIKGLANGTEYTFTVTTSNAVGTSVTSKASNSVTPMHTSVVAWNDPADITYGTALTETQLNATADVAGTFAYNPAAGTILDAGNAQAITVTFTPNEKGNTSVSKTVNINVGKATPTIEWKNPSSIIYGTKLDNASVSYNGTAVAGTFSYTDNGNTFTTSDMLTAGTHDLKVTFTPADALNYNNVEKDVSINVAKALLTATANSYSIREGQPIPVLDVTYSGFINGDAEADIDSKPIAKTTATNTSKTGIYDVVVEGGSDNNYDFSYVSGKLTISNPIVVSSLKAPQPACEGDMLSLPYTLASGNPTEYQIIFDDKASKEGFSNSGYSLLTSDNGTISISVPSKIADGTYNASLQLRDSYGNISKPFPFQLTVNVSADAIVTKFGSIVLIDNHDNRFNGYQWYKDGSAINGAASQFYKDPNGLSGTYHAQLKTATGQTLNTCSKVIDIKKSAQASVSIYPNPVRSGQEFSVRLSGFANEELQGAVLSVYSTQGVPVLTLRKVEQENRLTLSGTDGVYMGRITTADGQVLTFKVVLAN